MNVKEILRQKIYKIITDECCDKGDICYLNMIINDGKNGVSGEDADFLIFYSADAINLPREYIVNRFPYEKYFEKESNSLLIPFTLVYYIILYYLYIDIVKIIFYFY